MQKASLLMKVKITSKAELLFFSPFLTTHNSLSEGDQQLSRVKLPSYSCEKYHTRYNNCVTHPTSLYTGETGRNVQLLIPRSTADNSSQTQYEALDGAQDGNKGMSHAFLACTHLT